MKRHSDFGHQKKYSELTTYFRESSVSHTSRVLSAELMMAQFIGLHNVPFQAADYLTICKQLVSPTSLLMAFFQLFMRHYNLC